MEKDKGNFDATLQGGRQNTVNMNNKEGSASMFLKSTNKNKLTVKNAGGDLKIKTRGGRYNEIAAENEGGGVTVETRGGIRNTVEVGLVGEYYKPPCEEEPPAELTTEIQTTPNAAPNKGTSPFSSGN
jgi:hypothetical protein